MIRSASASFESGCSDALGGHAFSFPTHDGDRRVEEFRLFKQVMLLC